MVRIVSRVERNQVNKSKGDLLVTFFFMNIPAHKLIEFVNLVNECCEVVGSELAEDWLITPNCNLNEQTPFDLFLENRTDKLYELLRFIEIDEADIC